MVGVLVVNTGICSGQFKQMKNLLKDMRHFKESLGVPEKQALRLSFQEQCLKPYCRTGLVRKQPLILRQHGGRTMLQYCQMKDLSPSPHWMPGSFPDCNLYGYQRFDFIQFLLISLKARHLSHCLYKQNRYPCQINFSHCSLSHCSKQRHFQFGQHLDALTFLVEIQCTLYENAFIILTLSLKMPVIYLFV